MSNIFELDLNDLDALAGGVGTALVAPSTAPTTSSAGGVEVLGLKNKPGMGGTMPAPPRPRP